MTRRSFPLVLALVAMVVAACDAPAAPTTTAPLAGPQTVVTVEPSTTTSSSTTIGVTIPGASAAFQAEIDALVATTEDLRGLRFEAPPAVTIVSPEELARRVRADVADGLEDVEADQSLYRLLGLLDPGVDLAQLYSDLYGEQVAGFYDGDAGELVVPAGGDTLTPLERSTLVHELTHALTDQRFGIWQKYRDLVDAEDFDAATAMLGVIEGDAVLTQILYVQTLPDDERQSLLQDSLAAGTDVFDSAPRFLRDSLVFPYDTGLDFVAGVFGESGHGGVDALYRDPPDTTEQVIDRDPSETPISVAAVPVTLDGYDQVYDTVWGELGFRLMLDQIVGDDSAASGWGGDRFELWVDGSGNAVASFDYRGDTAGDASDLGDALRSYLTEVTGSNPRTSSGASVFTGRSWASVEVDGDRLVMVIADRASDGKAVFARLSG